MKLLLLFSQRKQANQYLMFETQLRKYNAVTTSLSREKEGQEVSLRIYKKYHFRWFISSSEFN